MISFSQKMSQALISQAKKGKNCSFPIKLFSEGTEVFNKLVCSDPQTSHVIFVMEVRRKLPALNTNKY